MKRLLRLAAALIPLLTTQALAQDCAPGSTGLSARPRPAETEQGRFKIFWHVATQIEELADPGSNRHAIQTVQPLVDGYFLNVISSGLLAYWPGRPQECALNFNNARNTGNAGPASVAGKAVISAPGQENTETNCKTQQAQALGSADIKVVQDRAFKAALKNLDLSGEQRRGKIIISEMLLSNAEITADQASGKISVTKMPRTMCALTEAGIAPDIVMMYQEPVPQKRNGTLVNLPVGPGRFAQGPVAGQLSNNPYGFSQVADALRQAGAPVANFAPDFRAWNSRRENSIYPRFAKLNSLAAFLFEGGTAPARGQSGPRILGYAQGAAWILQNTNDEVVFMMPPYYLPQEVAAPNGVDGLIPRLEKTIRDLNAAIGSAMGLPTGKNAICTSRIVLIPASYGSPLHPQTFPAQRPGGAFAGTVTGQIEMLAKLRAELCGKG